MRPDLPGLSPSYLHTAGDRRLELMKVWKWGYPQSVTTYLKKLFNGPVPPWAGWKLQFLPLLVPRNLDDTCRKVGNTNTPLISNCELLIIIHKVWVTDTMADSEWLTLQDKHKQTRHILGTEDDLALAWSSCIHRFSREYTFSIYISSNYALNTHYNHSQSVMYSL